MYTVDKRHTGTGIEMPFIQTTHLFREVSRILSFRYEMVNEKLLRELCVITCTKSVDSFFSSMGKSMFIVPLSSSAYEVRRNQATTSLNCHRESVLFIPYLERYYILLWSLGVCAQYSLPHVGIDGCYVTQ